MLIAFLCAVSVAGLAQSGPTPRSVAFAVAARSGDPVTTPFGPGTVSYVRGLVLASADQMVLHATIQLTKANDRLKPYHGALLRRDAKSNEWVWVAPTCGDWVDADNTRWIDFSPTALAPDGTVAAVYSSGSDELDRSGPRGLLLIQPDGARRIITRSDSPSPDLPDAPGTYFSEYRFFPDGSLRFVAPAHSAERDRAGFRGMSLWSLSNGELRRNFMHAGTVKGLGGCTANMIGLERIPIDRWFDFDRRITALPVMRGREGGFVIAERDGDAFKPIFGDVPTVTLEDGAVKELTVTRVTPLANGSLAIQGFAGTEAWARIWVLNGNKLESIGRAVDLPPCPGIGKGQADSLSMFGELEGGAILCMAAERAMPLGLVAVKGGAAHWLTWKGALLPGGGTVNPRLDHVEWRTGMRAGLYVVWTGADKPPRYLRVTAAGLSELYSPNRVLPGLEELGPVQLGSVQVRLTPQIDGWIVSTVYTANGSPVVVATNINIDAPMPVKDDQAPPPPAVP